MRVTTIVVRVKHVFKEFTRTVLPNILFILIILFHIHNIYSYAYHITDYISDECWYVSSARNLLVKVFNTQPTYVSSDGFLGVNVEVSDSRVVHDVIVKVLNSGGRVVKSDYSNIQLVYVEVPNVDILNDLGSISGVKNIVLGFRYPDSKEITDYLNTEHPPLVKYLIALSILACGDKPLCWRIPSMIASISILVLIYLIIRFVVGGVTGSYLGVVAALITASDTLFRSLSVVAMLDIFTSLFTVLTLYLLLRDRIYSSLTTLGLAFISKYSGLFTAPTIAYVMIKKRIAPINTIFLIMVIPLIMLVLSSLPIIKSLGIQRWWFEAIENAVRWHLSIKTISGPPTSAPWEWLLGWNPFILHYTYVSGEWVADLIARGNNILYLTTLATTTLVLPLISRLPDKGLATIYTWCTFLMYVIIWLLGGKTQYSFYMVQITPLIYTSLIIHVFWLTFTDNFKILIRKWLEIIKYLIKWLRGEVIIKIYVRLENVEL